MANRLEVLQARQRGAMLDDLCAKFAGEWHGIVNHPLYTYMEERVAARPGYQPSTRRAYMERRAAEVVRWNLWAPEQASELASRVGAWTEGRGRC